MRWVIVIVVVASACSFTVPPEGGGGGGGGGGPDASGTQRPPPQPGACSKPGALRDDFADGVAAAWWSVLDPGAVVEQSGTLAITPAGTTWSGYASRAMVDLRDAAAEIEVRDVTGTASADFGVAHGAKGLGFRIANGQLELGSTGSFATSIAWDPVAHRHLQIAAANGMVTFSAAPDGLAWTTLGMVASPAWIDHVQIAIGSTQTGATPGTATFAEHSTFVPTADWCAVSQLSDTFDDAKIGRPWAYHAHTGTSCAEFETMTSAQVDQYAGGACDASFGSSKLFTLAGGSITARITAIGNYVAGWTTYIGGWNLDGSFIRLAFDQDEMCADGTNVARTCVDYADSEDLWRIREAGGTLYFEMGQASNSSAWRVVHSLANPIDLSALRIRLGTLTDRDIGQTIALGIDRFN